MKQSDEQIKQAVEEWVKNIREDHQRILAMGASIDCIDETYVEILVNALDLINRLETENRKLHVELQAINNSRKCITGYNPYGLCSCCKADGQNCCIGCKDKQDCNISCGWIPGEEVSHGNQDV